MRLSIRTLTILIIQTLMFTSLSPATHASSGFSGGLITSDLTLSSMGGPYIIDRTIEIPSGTKLTIQPGVVLRNTSNSELFHIHGELDIEGTLDSPVLIETSGDVFYLSGAPKNSKISVKFARIDGLSQASLVPPTGNSQSSNYLFQDSEFINMGDYSYIWYQESFIAQRNVFASSAGFSVGFDARNRINAPVFRNNLFLGSPKPTYGDEYWIQSWASYGAPMLVENNTFSAGPYTAIRTKYSDGGIRVDASSNYWETQDSQAIQGMVVDSRDGLDYGGQIITDTPLASKHLLTPTGLRLTDRSSPAPTSPEISEPIETPEPTEPAQGSASGLGYLVAGNTSLSWDPEGIFEPSGCTRYSFNYRQSNVLIATFDVRNRFGDVLGIGSLGGSSGTESLQICDFQFKAESGPFKVVLSSTSDYSSDFSSGGDTFEAEAEIRFLSRTKPNSPQTGNSLDGVVNAGSFKGFVALYAKGFRGKRFSAKVGKDWVVRPALESDFVRIVEFTGAGYSVNVRIFIDGVLTKTVSLVTK